MLIEKRDTEILFFTIIIIMFKTRKQGNITFLPYFSSACMFMKLGNILLYFSAGPVFGIVYICLCLVQLLLLPEPTYQGPENISYLKGEDFDEELAKEKQSVMLVELYTAWSPPCVEFSSVFSELSNKYCLENLRFIKIDLARSPETAQKFKINTSTFSKQLPTLVLFKNGKELMRRPLVNEKGKLIHFSFTFDNVVMEYDLKNLHEECKKNLNQKKEKLSSNQKKEN
ncbi:thioredoxin-related transmembrane protein 2-like protein [Sarcoptes scabiei]|uniref:Thioredoxin-related transmembrane protein 2-like protein n=1 Tax=Sarcoptes scabiei TaxID=52283 RepID=A0A132AEE3_SARSC|nr:thioredoxin-related transmembrane protein 2-like protein [Sarcoptes scabiei]